MGKDNCIEFTVLTEDLWTATEKHDLWVSDLSVLFAKSSHLNRDGTIPFVGLDTIAEETDLSVTQVKRCRERLVKAGLLTFEGHYISNLGRKVFQYLPTCIFLTGHIPQQKKGRKGLTMRICEMRNDRHLKKLEPITSFLMQFAIGKCGGLLDFGLMPEPENGSEPDVKTFAQFLVDAGQCENLKAARNLIQRLRDAGIVRSKQRYKRTGKGGRLAAFYYLNLPVS